MSLNEALAFQIHINSGVCTLATCSTLGPLVPSILQCSLALCNPASPCATAGSEWRASRKVAPWFRSTASGGYVTCNTVDGRNPAPPGMYKTL